MSQEIDAFLLANGAAQSERMRRQGPGIVRPAAFRFVFIERARVESSLPLGFTSAGVRIGTRGTKIITAMHHNNAALHQINTMLG